MSNYQAAELLQQGIAAVKAGHAEEARQLLLQVVELDERSEQAWLWLSSVVETEEDRRVCLENVLAINPDNTHALNGLQWLQQKASAPAPAPSTAPEEAALPGEDRCPHCGAPVPPSGAQCPYCSQPLIVACPACGEYVEVTQASCPDCGQHLGDYRQGAAYHLALAEKYIERRRLEQAEESIGHAEADAPDDPDVLATAAGLYEKVGRPELAVAAYRQAIEQSPDDVSLYARLGALHRQRGQHAEALAMYERAAQLARKDSEILFELAQIRVEAEGPTEESFDMVQRVLKADPEHAGAHLLLGDIYASQQQREKAYRHYSQASRLTAPESQIGLEASTKMLGLQHGLRQTSEGIQAGSSRGYTAGGVPISGPRHRPGCLTLYAILVIITGLLGILATLGVGVSVFLGGETIEEMLTIPGAVEMPFSMASFTTSMLIAVGVGLLAGIFNLAIGLGLWSLKNWARIITIILNVLGMLGSIAQATIMIGGVRLLSSFGGAPVEFPLWLMITLLVALIIQGYIIFWFVANGDLFD